MNEHELTRADAAAEARPAAVAGGVAARGVPYSVLRAADGTVTRNIHPAKMIEGLGAGAQMWVDIDSSDRAQHALLEKVFEFHPLAIEDTLTPRTRVKLEEYGPYIFLVVRSVKFDHRTEDPYDLDTTNLYAFLGPHYLVTVHGEAVRAIDEVKDRIERSTNRMDRGVEMVLHGVLDTVVDEFIPMVDRVDDMVDTLEQRLFEAYDQHAIQEIFQLKRLVVQLRRHLGPLREVLNVVTNRPHACIAPQAQLYYRDVYDHTIRIVESLESVRDLLATVLDTYLTQTSNRMNQVMKQLNVVATISLPLVVIGGIFGMNFSGMPLTHSPWGFFAALGIMIVSALIIWWFIKRQQWT